MNNDLERVWKETVVPSCYYPAIYREELRKSLKSRTIDIQTGHI